MACNPFHLMTTFTALFTLQSFVIAKNNGNMTVGTEISTSTGNVWISSSGDFTFGFHQLDANTFLPAIWYSDIPETIVWWVAADGEHANTGPKGSKILLTADEGLVLRDLQGDIPWGTPLSGGSVHDCYLEDTGNLVIRGTDGEKLWQSFDNPRDTMLPSQTIAAGVQSFYSKLSETNFNRGRFQLSLTKDGNLNLNARSPDPNGAVYADDTVYYKIETNTSNPGVMLRYNSSDTMYVLQKNGTEINLLDGVKVPTPENDYYFRATLNFDGVLVWYFHQKNSSSPNSGWSVITYQPVNICISLQGSSDSGACGYNAICTLGGGDYPRPYCSCPTGYTFLDPADKLSICMPNFELGCEENNGYYMEQIENTDWPNNHYDHRVSLTAEECKNSCLGDCFCTASIHKDKDCWKKRYPLSNGCTNSSSIQAMAFLKVKNADNPSVRAEHKVVKVLASSLATLVFVFLVALLCGIRFIYNRQYNNFSRIKKAYTEHNSVKCFTYKELEEATEGFKQELGRGSCAVVYKGAVGRNPDGSEALVAVKKIDRTFLQEADKEYQTEINVIGQTRHRNLVRLIGYCNEEEHHLLVYEFMSNGCLADFLFRVEKPSWVDRINIAHAIAKGLLYLHEECNTQIIHCDIKPQNILLDDHFGARISDFGISKLLMLNQFHTVTAIRGTKGYVAPEWFRNKSVTAKVDVYSFGVVLLEIISCRRSILRDAMEDDPERAALTDWAFSCYMSGSLENLTNGDEVALGDRERLVRFVKMGIWCTQEDPNLRPTMRQVNLMLEGIIEVPGPPIPSILQSILFFKLPQLIQLSFNSLCILILLPFYHITPLMPLDRVVVYDQVVHMDRRCVDQVKLTARRIKHVELKMSKQVFRNWLKHLAGP